MSSTFITEFGGGASGFSGVPISAAQDNGPYTGGGTGATYDQPVLTNSGSSQQSAPFRSTTRLIRITSDGIISYRCGPSAVTAVTDRRLPAGAIEYVGVTPGHCVAIITNT